MAKMKVWTRQDIRILEHLQEYGFYRCKAEYIENKMENFAEYYKKLYQWYGKRSENIVPRPDQNIEYPIWVSIDEEMQLRPVEGTVILELEIDSTQIVITDVEKWGYVVNFFYLPLNYDDLAKYNNELKRYRIADESELIMGSKGNFYPLLKKKIVDSWERLFDPYKLSGVMQGTTWEIKKEWVQKIHYGGDQNE